ncbi:hypothetical protein DFS34DRAFT_692350 [Phlyctochytrium arcticum]|nr:hypothetical protein DFS34DRAFT_692350 [Phlyctochytrium arcticum]
MLLLKSIIAITAILSASAHTTSPIPSLAAPTIRPLVKTPLAASTTPSLGKTSSPSSTSGAQTQTGTKCPSAPQGTGPSSKKRETRKLSEDSEIGLLKDVRGKMTFLPYTAKERVFVAQQRQATLNVYANVEEKLKNCIRRRCHCELSDILKNAGNMTNNDFSYAMARHALSLRDVHTNFLIGGQHSCYLLGTPYDFDFVTSDDIVMNPQVVVRAVSQDPEFNAMFPPEALAIKPGDLLDTIDGKSFRDYWISTQNMTGGANQFGGYRQALKMLSRQDSAIFPLPSNNEIEFGFRQATGKSTMVKVPYVAQGDRQCIRDAPKERDTPPPPLPPPNPKSQGCKATKSDIVLHTTYKAKDFTMGVIRLNSFEPGELSESEVVDVIRTLLTDTLDNTDGVLLDVRVNPGGQIAIAERIIQSFTGVTDPVQTQAINQATNRIVFGNENLNTDAFRADRLALQNAAPTNKFAKPVGFRSVELLNMDGHAYLRPVAVLTDGECYSSCDFFCAGMQDNGAAIIFGEDPQTGAGGANVLDHEEELQVLAPTSFKPLPFQGSLGKDEDNNTIPIPDTSGMRVAIRRAVRIGRNAGKILEDVGVQVDEVIRQTPAEFAQTQGEVFPQFEHIAMRLKQQAVKDGRSKLQFQSPFGFRFLTNFTIPFNSSGFDRIEVRDSKGSLIVDQRLSPECEESSGELMATKKPALGWDRYNILGFKGSQKMMTIKRPIAMLPDLSQLPEVAAGKSIANPPLVIFNHDNDEGQKVAAPKEGWQRSQDGSLSIRPTTLDSVNARAVFPFKVGKGATLNIKADVQLKTPANLATLLPTDLKTLGTLLVMGVFPYNPKSGSISDGVLPVERGGSFTEKINFTVKNMSDFDTCFALLVISYSTPDIKNSLDRSAALSNLIVSG